MVLEEPFAITDLSLGTVRDGLHLGCQIMVLGDGNTFLTDVWVGTWAHLPIPTQTGHPWNPSRTGVDGVWGLVTGLTGSQGGFHGASGCKVRAKAKTFRHTVCPHT